MSSAPQIPDLPDVEDPRDRYARLAAVGIVVATLATAAVTYLLTAAGRAGNAADVRAQRFGVEAMAAAVRSQQSAQVSFEAFLKGQEQARLSANALQESVFAERADRPRLELEAARAREVAARLYELSAIRLDGPEGPEQDPAFPLRLFTRAQWASVRLAALQDAANEESGAWQDRVARYAAILTFFAVAVYLLSSSRTLPQRMRAVFLGVGAVLLGVGLLWAIGTAFDQPRRAPDQAADEYAHGYVAWYTGTGPSDYRRARDHFSRAIALRPTFAKAYQRRATATFNSESPLVVIFPSVSSPQAVTSAADDLRRARSLGLRSDALVLIGLGWNEFLLGLQEHRSSLIDQSIQHTRDAIKLDPDHPVGHYNLGLALLARGEIQAARAAYTEAVRYTIRRDGSQGGSADDFGLQEQLVASALTDLEMLGTARREQEADVRAMKQFIVGAVSTAGRHGGTTDAAVTDTRADVYASQVQVSEMGAVGFDPDRDVLSVQWYYAPPGGVGWAVLPHVSGTMEPGQDTDGTYYVLSPYLSATVPPTCLGEGQYRAEIYINGRLVDEATADWSGPSQAAAARELRLALCHPPTWEHSDRSLLGVRETYLAPERDRGVAIFRITPPARYGQLPPQRRSAAVLDATLARFGSDLPSRLTFDKHGEDSYFLGLEGSLTRWYRFPGGEAFVGAAIDDDGTVVIGLVFGPDGYFDDDEPNQVFDSILTL